MKSIKFNWSFSKDFNKYKLDVHIRVFSFYLDLMAFPVKSGTPWIYIKSYTL